MTHQCVTSSVQSAECRGFESHRGSSFFLEKVTALGVLCCFTLFVCLTLLASFFLPSSSPINMYSCEGKAKHIHVCAGLVMHHSADILHV